MAMSSILVGVSILTAIAAAPGKPPRAMQPVASTPMNKGVANFYHYHEVSQAANERYLTALAVVDQPRASAKLFDRV